MQQHPILIGKQGRDYLNFEGKPVRKRRPDGTSSEVQGGANGVALSADGKTLFYAPLMARHLYSVDTAALLDPATDDAAVAPTPGPPRRGPGRRRSPRRLRRPTRRRPAS